MKQGYFALLAILFMAACTSPQNQKASNTVVCTTGIIADACQELLRGVDSIRVTALMGPGVDPHLYKATQGDIKKLMQADLIVYNGLHLEGKMTDLFEKMTNRNKLAAAEAIPMERLINNSDFAGAYDPHVWFDVQLWQIAVKAMAEKLIEQYPELTEKISQNTENHLADLEALNKEVENRILEIPKMQRTLITAHDAFKYYGLQYGIEVRGLQGISTSSEYGIRDVSDLAQYVYKNEIRSIFVESSIPKRAIKAVQAAVIDLGGEVSLGGELYSDALGSAGSPAGTYIGMVRTNTETIVAALK
jgi:manganese/zinc/iron transport system substrate-binding protein